MVRTYQNIASGGIGNSFGVPSRPAQPQIRERTRSVDYDEILNKKRQEESAYRGNDPFGFGGGSSSMRGSNSDNQLSRTNVNGLNDTYTGIRRGLDELTGTLQRLQNINDENAFGDSFNASGSSPRRGTEPFIANAGRRSQAQNVPSSSKSGPPGFSGYGSGIGGFSDPMANRRQQPGGGGVQEGYNPSLYGGQRNNVRRGGGNHPPANDRRAYQLELERQMEEDKMRKMAQKKADNLDWWEKAPPSQHQPPPEPPKQRRPHPNQGQAQLPRVDRRTYEEELKQQVEDQNRRKEEEKRKEREEDEKIERRLKEQQERMNAEYEEEQAKKRAKEEAKQKRQDDLARKQRQMQEQVEQARIEAAEAKKRERLANAKRAKDEQAAEAAAAQAANGLSPPQTPPTRDFRTNSTRGVRGGGYNDDDDGRDDTPEVVNQLNGFRNELDRKSEEHEAVWNGLVEV